VDAAPPSGSNGEADGHGANGPATDPKREAAGGAAKELAVADPPRE
jgi:hypothetical protein